MKPLYAVFGGVAIAAVTAAGTVAYMRSGQQPTREQAAAPSEAAASVATVKPRADQILRLVCKGKETIKKDMGTPEETVEDRQSTKSVVVDFNKGTFNYDGRIQKAKIGDVQIEAGDAMELLKTGSGLGVTLNRVTGSIGVSDNTIMKMAGGLVFNQTNFSGECQEVKGPKF